VSLRLKPYQPGTIAWRSSPVAWPPSISKSSAARGEKVIESSLWILLSTLHINGDYSYGDDLGRRGYDNEEQSHCQTCEHHRYSLEKT
jgi:hypothetical protein